VRGVIYPELSFEIIGCAFEVFNNLGPNHREHYYQKALAKEFVLRKIDFIEQYKIDLLYKKDKIGRSYFDFYVDNKIVVELKAGNSFQKANFSQILDYLKSSNTKLGIIILFSQSGVKFRRILNQF